MEKVKADIGEYATRTNMDTFDNLWQAYLHTLRGGEHIASDQISALRRAFFAGAWSQMKFTQRILQIEDAIALKLMVAAELELSDEMKQIRTTYSQGRRPHK